MLRECLIEYNDNDGTVGSDSSDMQGDSTGIFNCDDGAIRIPCTDATLRGKQSHEPHIFPSLTTKDDTIESPLWKLCKLSGGANNSEPRKNGLGYDDGSGRTGPLQTYSVAG